MKRFAIAFLFLLFISPFIAVSSGAQQGGVVSGNIYELPEGSVVAPRGDSVSVWNNPPSGFLNSLGDKVGQFDEKQKYVVEGMKEVPSIFGKQYWLKVRPVEAPLGGTLPGNGPIVDPCGPNGCWAYQGKAGTGATNFSPIEER